MIMGDYIHTHPNVLQDMTTPWPFHTWGLDLIGPINPVSNGHKWILVATKHFTKWVEVIPLKKVTGQQFPISSVSTLSPSLGSPGI